MDKVSLNFKQVYNCNLCHNKRYILDEVTHKHRRCSCYTLASPYVLALKRYKARKHVNISKKSILDRTHEFAMHGPVNNLYGLLKSLLLSEVIGSFLVLSAYRIIEIYLSKDLEIKTLSELANYNLLVIELDSVPFNSYLSSLLIYISHLRTSNHLYTFFYHELSLIQRPNFEQNFLDYYRSLGLIDLNNCVEVQ